MSLWLPDHLHIELAPDQVAVEHRSVELKMFAAIPRRLSRQLLPTGGDAGPAAWDGALRTLAAILEQEGRRRRAVTVVLANRFVRYALVPQSPQLGPDEQDALLRHCFMELYGEAAGRWDLRLSPAPGMPCQPAAGVDRGLIDGLRALFGGGRLHLRSIQPRLMAVCNEHRTTLGAGPAWLLLAEAGQLCLGLVANGGLTRLRTLRAGPDWSAELPALLEREAFLAELEQPPADVLLWQQDGTLPALPADGPLRLHRLVDPAPAEADADGEALVLARI